MKILIACEESQAVCKEFRAKGHEAFSCDLQECSGGHPEWHIQGDVLAHLNDGWDMMIGHPECKYLCFSGERYCKGYSDCQKKNETIQSFANSIADDNARLVKLVQAQKELIAIYEKAITLGDPDVWELYSKIQKLES